MANNADTISGARPIAQAGVADELTIEIVVRMSDGLAYEARALLEQEDFRVIRLRNQLIDSMSAVIEGRDPGPHAYLCASCGEPVRILSSFHQREVYYFQHALRGVNCQLTINRLSKDEITARQFHGQGEGERHKRLKRLLYASLQADPAFSDIALERYWKPSNGDGRGKQPDVQASYQGMSHAFEAQLSSTSGITIAARNAFYREQGAVITWFTDSVPASDWRMYLKDIAAVHRGNIFVVDEKTAVASMKAKQFLIRCHYSEPVREGDEIKQVDLVKVIQFADLRKENGLTFYVDSMAALEAALAIGASSTVPHPCKKRPARSERWAGANELLDRLPGTHPRALMLELLANPRSTKTGNTRMQELHAAAKAALEAAGITLPEIRDEQFNQIDRRMAGLFSAELGKPVGFRFVSLVQVAHQIDHDYQKSLTSFVHVARHFLTDKLLLEQDLEGHWERKLENMRRSAKYRVSAPTVWKPYEPERWWRDFVRTVYPEVAAFHRLG